MSHLSTTHGVLETLKITWNNKLSNHSGRSERYYPTSRWNRFVPKSVFKNICTETKSNSLMYDGWRLILHWTGYIFTVYIELSLLKADAQLHGFVGSDWVRHLTSCVWAQYSMTSLMFSCSQMFRVLGVKNNFSQNIKRRSRSFVVKRPTPRFCLLCDVV